MVGNMFYCYCWFTSARTLLCRAMLYLLFVFLLLLSDNDADCLLQCAGIEYVIVRIHCLTKHVQVIQKAYTIHLSYAPASTVKPANMSQLTAVLLSSQYVSINNIPTMQIFTGIPEILTQNHICYH